MAQQPRQEGWNKFQQQLICSLVLRIFLAINGIQEELEYNKIMRKTSEELSIASLPKRNNKLEVGKFRKIVIESNRFKVDVSKLSCLCIFGFKVVSEKEDQNHDKRLQILKQILPQIKEFIHEPIIKDGLIFSHQLPKTPDKTIKHGEFIVVIREISRFDAQKNSSLLLYFLGNVMRKMMEKLQYIEVGQTRKFINMKKFIEVENLLVYSGFKAHFELLGNGYYLTVDTTKKIVRNQSVIEFINYVYKVNDGLDRNEKREMVRKALINRTIMTNYGKTRYIKVEDVLFVDLTQVIIESCKMPLPQYYKFRYDYQIKNLKQPLIFANNKKTKFKTYLVPELCLMTGIPEDFDESKNKYIIDVSRISAEERKQQIQDFVKNMNSKQGDELFPLLGVTINEKCEKVQAKLIPPPKIVLGENRSIAKGRQSNFNLHDLPIYRVNQSTKLAILTFDDIDSATIIEYFYKTFKALKTKIEISVLRVDAKSKRGMDVLSTYIGLAKEKENCNFCLIIIPNCMKHLYQKIKEATLLEKQIGCQVVLESTLKNKNLLTVALKVLLQILAKSGNSLWRAVSEHHKDKVMFVGYYSSEVGKTKTNQLTVGICSTCDDSHTQIFVKTRQYSKQHEEVQNMKELLLEALAVYKKKNGCVPSDIVIMENNKKSMRNEDSSTNFFIQPLIKLMEEYYGLKRPKIIYLLITKCLSHRFFRMFEGKCANPPLGTLIDQQVNSSNRDFYLIAHNICKKGGSIAPLNYKIVFSDSTMEQDVLYSMIFAQCFNYPNYTGAIRQPGVLQNAIKCTKFGADALSNRQLPDKFKVYPYFL